jgi:hypothetical protein
MNDERNKAMQLADRLDTLGLSLILKQTTDELRRLHGENEVLRQFLSQIPPQREWQGLTDEENSEIYNRNYNLYAHDMHIGDFFLIQQAVEAKLKEKNR